MLRIALASPPVSGSVDTAMPWVERFIAEAADGEADIVCFPECYIPGLRGQDFAVEAHERFLRVTGAGAVSNRNREFGTGMALEPAPPAPERAS